MSDLQVRLGTRASPLARWQADWVAGELRSRGIAVEVALISTQGDRQQVGPIAALGGQGVFTKELQRALLANEIDLAVHSLKDLPTDPTPGLELASVPTRGPVGDLLLTRTGCALTDLPEGAVVGTGSLRRRAQLLHARPDLQMRDVRGNVDTRLRKLDEGEYDALILAAAGVTRLGLADRPHVVLSPAVMLPAVGQGALGIETRAHDASTQAAVRTLDDPATHAAVLAERSLLAELRGGCLAPVGAWGRLVESELLTLTATVLSVNGASRLDVELAAFPADAVDLGRWVAADLLSRGAAELIATARTSPPRADSASSAPS